MKRVYSVPTVKITSYEADTAIMITTSGAGVQSQFTGISKNQINF
jgi:hypothetical protein